MAVIETRGLEKNFGRVKALAGVDLSVEAGEVYGFIGPNGAGKSTTIRVLLGLLKKSGGEVTVFGKEAYKDAVSIHERIVYVPGDVNLWPNLSGGEVIDLFVKMKQGRGAKAKDALIERFDFDPAKKCGTYSKGNRQKVALIAAFSTEADLYILDEPTSGLDPLMEIIFRDCVAEVKAAGKTVFLSSHILSEVEQLADRISIIRRGKIIDTGTLGELRHLTHNNVTAELAGAADGIAGLPGVFDFKTVNGVATFSLDNHETEGVLSALAAIGIKRFESVPPTLEELFMSHYGVDAGELAGDEAAAGARRGAGKKGKEARS